MTPTHFKTTPSKAANRIMVLLIAAPLVFTMIMWILLPSGYERQFCKKDLNPSIKTWQPLQAGLKYVVSVF